MRLDFFIYQDYPLSRDDAIHNALMPLTNWLKERELDKSRLIFTYQKSKVHVRFLDEQLYTLWVLTMPINDDLYIAVK
jgi:hypothetical protein